MTWRKGPEMWLAATLFLAFFIYLWQGVGAHLLYYGFGIFHPYPVFSWDLPYLRVALESPGGSLQVLTAFLTAGYYNAYLGALLITMVLLFLYLGTRTLMGCAGVKGYHYWALGPPVIALMVFNQYDNPLFDLLCLGCSIWGVVLYQRLVLKTRSVRTAGYIICFALLYCMAGGSVFVFAVTVCIMEVILRRDIKTASLYALLALGSLFLLGRLLYFLVPETMILTGTPWCPIRRVEFFPLSNLLRAILFLYVPVLVLGLSLYSLMIKRFFRRLIGESRPKQALRPWGRSLVRAVPVIGIIVLCVVFSRSVVRYERLLNYHVFHREWQQVLQVADAMKEDGIHFSRSSLFDINRALAHSRKLGDYLCAYPQNGSRSLFMAYENVGGRLQFAKLLELHLDLGDYNAAERCAYELMEHEGTGTHALTAMVRVHLAKGQYEIARVAYRVLRRQLGWRHYVRPWQDIFNDPDGFEDHATVRNWQGRSRTTDYIRNEFAFERLLTSLLRDRPNNRLAYEYLMGFYLMEHQHEKLVRFLPAMRSLGYQRLPQHLAEAVLVHSLMTKKEPDARGWRIEPFLQERLRKTMAVVQRAGDNDKAAFEQLAPEIGDTYTFYSMFGLCGVK